LILTFQLIASCVRRRAGPGSRADERRPDNGFEDTKAGDESDR
jgi:hypothetical protein